MTAFTVVICSLILLVIANDIAAQGTSGNARTRSNRGASKSKSKSAKPKVQVNVMKWSTALPNGEIVEETIKTVPGVEKMYLRSTNVSTDSGFTNSSSLIYFTKNLHVVKFTISSASGERRDACFITTPRATFDQTRQELQRRASSRNPISTSPTRVRFVAEAANNVSKEELKNKGRSAYVFCKRASSAGNVFNLVQTSSVPISTTSLVSSGNVSPTLQSTSVPYIVALENSINLWTPQPKKTRSRTRSRSRSRGTPKPNTPKPKTPRPRVNPPPPPV